MGDQSLSYSWTPGSGNGLPLSSQEIEVATDGAFSNLVAAPTLAGDATTTTVTGLTNSVLHYARMRGRHAVGPGPWSDVATGTPTAAAGSRLENTTKLRKVYLDLTLSPNTEKVIDITGSSNAAATIQSGMAGAVAGDKFRVTGAAGTYSWTSAMSGVASDGGVGNWITVYVDSADIFFNSTGANHNGIDLKGRSYWQLAGFRLDKSDRAVNSGWETGIYVGGEQEYPDPGWNSTNVSGHHIRVVDNSFSGFPVGIQCQRCLGNYFAAGNKVFENAWYHTGGGQGMDTTANWYNVANPNQAAADADPIVPGFPFVVHGNEVYNNRQYVGSSTLTPPKPTEYTDGNGIIFGDNNPDTAGFHQGPFLASSNLCYWNGGRGIGPYLTKNVTIANNTCWHNWQHGKDTNATGPGDIIDPNPGGEISFYNCPNITVVYNYCEADLGVNWSGLYSTTSRSRHCIQNIGGTTTINAASGNNYKVNPSLLGSETSMTGDIDTGTSSQLESTATLGDVDFRFDVGSPLLNAGKGTPAITEDFGGNTRTIEGTVDIGAYELAAGT